MSDQPPQENSEDPWAAAQNAPFVVGGAEQERARLPPSGGSSPDTSSSDYDPDRRWGGAAAWHLEAERRRGIATAGLQGQSRRPDPKSKTFQITCGILAALGIAGGVLTTVMLFRLTAERGAEAVDRAVEARGKLELQNAIRAEQIYAAQRERFTDDVAELRPLAGGSTLVQGFDPIERDVTYVGVCEDGAVVVVNRRVTAKTVWAVLMTTGSKAPFYAIGPQPCPDSYDPLPGQWSSTDEVLTGGAVVHPGSVEVMPVPAPTYDDSSRYDGISPRNTSTSYPYAPTGSAPGPIRTAARVIVGR